MLPSTHTSLRPRFSTSQNPSSRFYRMYRPKKPYSPNNASARQGTRSSGARPVFSGSCSSVQMSGTRTIRVSCWSGTLFSHLARAKEARVRNYGGPPSLDGDQHKVFLETYNNPKSSWKSTFVTQPAGCSVGLDRSFERRKCVRKMAKARDGMDSGPARGSTRVAREHYDRS